LESDITPKDVSDKREYIPDTSNKRENSVVLRVVGQADIIRKHYPSQVHDAGSSKALQSPTNKKHAP